VGTFATTSTTTTEDSFGGVSSQSGGHRFLFNQYNRVERYIQVIDTTDSWSYTTDTIRQANAAAGNKVDYIAGDAAVSIRASLSATAFVSDNTSRAAKIGVGIDSTTAFSGLVPGGYLAKQSLATPPGGYFAMTGQYAGYPGLGYHTVNWLEKGGDVTCVFLGDNGGDSQQTGLIVRVNM
jgi:hypothetical protein